MKFDFTQIAAIAAFAITLLQMWRGGVNPFAPTPAPSPSPVPSPVPQADFLAQLKALFESWLAQRPAQPAGAPPAQAFAETYHVPIRFTVTPSVVSAPEVVPRA